MDGTYDVFWGSEVIGQARVERRGLYYHFDCRCKLTGEGICRVTVSCGGHHENLGILIPAGDDFVLSRKLAAKRLGIGKPEFRVLPRHQKTKVTFIPVYPDEPFRYLNRLQNAFMEVRNGQRGVSIPEMEG